MRDEWRKSLSARRVNALLTTASAIFKPAIRRGRARYNPVANSESAFVGSRELTTHETKDDRSDGIRAVSPDEVLSPDEIRRMLQAARPGFDRTLLMTAAITGMRSGKLLALRWGDLELPAEGRGKLFVRRTLTWARVQGNDSKPRPRFYPPKTQAGAREPPPAARAGICV